MPRLSVLPPPAAGKTGWPWTEETPPLPDKMPDGRSWPRISIVTPSFNQGQFIEETIRSVLLQGYPNLEYIIIDGGSKDGTVDIIRKYEPWFTYWVSEPDRGQSHAINKGLARCSGDIFNWINSDDLLTPGALSIVGKASTRMPGTVVLGAVEWFSRYGIPHLDVPRCVTLMNFLSPAEDPTTEMHWNQPACFLPLSAVKGCGGVREDLRLVMDFILMVHVLRNHSVTYVPETLARFRLHEDSKTVTETGARFRLEAVAALRKLRGIPELPSSGQLRKEYAKAVLMCGAQEGREGNFVGSLWNILRALLTAPDIVVRQLRRKPWILGLCLESLWANGACKGMDKLAERQQSSGPVSSQTDELRCCRWMHG